MDLEILDIGAYALARFEIARGGPHEEGPCPERPQVEVELALVVDKQGAASFRLQN
ncbi:MAG: hypothetical protein JAY75_05785 [Candidatus Thiodiazotropha taylori]|nr:hypothetical protein [Candidatus Thiodiazotropha taylori]MCG8075736.1 hypothetical protein [Candidatus Thiodiazotropha taylori]MCW4307720.1 hypothetical protein [Candidatus Thiodiazotropha endolucinida]MCW4333600.1 hypothetical protein [Candidatus Thiodiazotropha endolucinida]